MTRRDAFLSRCLAVALGVTVACFLVYGDVIEAAMCEQCEGQP